MPLLKSLRYAGVVSALLACTSIGAISVMIASARAEDPPAGLIGDQASTALARMNKTLTSKEFSFRSHTVRAYPGPNGELLHIAHTMKIVVRRPDRLLVDAAGDDGSTKMIYDGKALVVYGVTQKQYASIPAPGNIGGTLDVAESRKIGRASCRERV